MVPEDSKTDASLSFMFSWRPQEMDDEADAPAGGSETQ